MFLPYEEMYSGIKKALVKSGLPEETAEKCARVHTESSYDGVYSHGAGRVPVFCRSLREGWVDPAAKIELEYAAGAMQVYHGHSAPGIINALFCCDEAMKTADKYGIALAAVHDSSHWMRGGTYGKYLAIHGYIGILWSSTGPLMPPWGGSVPKIGNDPLVVAAPGAEPDKPFFADMAMTQYSYGKLQTLRLAGEKLPFPGGYDSQGVLTDDPAEIENSGRLIPMGYWKGAALGMMLDLLSVFLAGGKTPEEMKASGRGINAGCSQIFFVVKPREDEKELRSMKLRQMVQYLKSGEDSASGTGGVHIPGEGMERYHRLHDEKGIFVADSVWKTIQELGV